LEKALANTSSYIAARAASSPDLNFTASDALFEMDVNGDGKATNADVQALINYLDSGKGSWASTPEPASFVLLALGGLLLAGRRTRRKFIATK
jgi:hypothetical protein